MGRGGGRRARDRDRRRWTASASPRACTRSRSGIPLYEPWEARVTVRPGQTERVVVDFPARAAGSSPSPAPHRPVQQAAEDRRGRARSRPRTAAPSRAGCCGDRSRRRSRARRPRQAPRHVLPPAHDVPALDARERVVVRVDLARQVEAHGHRARRRRPGRAGPPADAPSALQAQVLAVRAAGRRQVREGGQCRPAGSRRRNRRPRTGRAGPSRWVRVTRRTRSPEASKSAAQRPAGAVLVGGDGAGP